MVALIKSLTKIIEKQNEYNERLARYNHATERHISVLHFKIAKLEGMKNE